ncbi:MAG: hypothetical protein EZS28_010489 [Streblomastix strix]|uniref:SPRY domain-containing protein n=1 Tax=Streblomastix strix TaxID=222440 RepID=A0A5J4WI49_9EUKA|nr:MAG: hypothetical protein EZS28_010489 [Streblomastix strix]
MSVPSEYNVICGFLGLGQDILLEVIRQISELRDLQQFLIINTKTFRLKDHMHFQQIIKSIINIDYFLQVPCLDDVSVNGDIFTNISNVNVSSILFDPIIDKGIVMIEILDLKKIRAIGIADKSVYYKRNEWIQARGFDIIIQCWNDGWIYNINDYVKGNSQFDTGDHVKMELNMEHDPHSLTFFVNDIEQPHYVVGIPSEVRIWIFLQHLGESFKILKFQKILNPVAQHGSGTQMWQWGKEWHQKNQQN